MTVDEYVSQKVASGFRPLVTSLRSIIKKSVPDVKEGISYGIPGYKLHHNRLMMVINSSKKHVLLSFSRGLSFEDKYRLLKGVGKSSRHLEFKKLEDVDSDIVGYYLQQAVKFDAAVTD